NYGSCALFIDTIDICYVMDVKSWEKRGISKPVSENVIRGSHEAFIETLRTNTSLIRRLVRQEKLICEGFKIGKSSKTPCNLLYIKGKTDEKIITELRSRLNAVTTDYITDSGELEQAIEDFSFLPSPQIIATERPDRAASAIMEGKAVIILDGSPFVLIAPINAFDLIKTADDKSLRFPYTNFVRILRIIAMCTSLLLPSIFVAVSCYHQEAIPIHLLFAISASRKAVPFSLITELILFEIAFEIIREASIRIPSPAGNAMGIIGGLIIGQSAIDANIVSPIVIIVVALTGIGSFTTPNYSLTFSFRILKYVYIILSAAAGFLGISLGIIVHLITLCNSQSFGIPFLAPFSDRLNNSEERFFMKPIWRRSGYKNPRDWAKGVNSTSTPVKKIQIK
ncbi:MAG: spore germination protein, partial [Clostridia bacterium]|nr:spore germination protein [Clostridia bacterium]